MASRVSSPVFVGRADELGELVAAMAGARACAPGLVLVGGEAGVGKSRLVAELIAYARADGDQILAGQCVGFDETTIPLLPVIDALRGLDDGAQDLLEARLAPVSAEAPPAGLHPLVLDRLAAAAASAPILLIVEDVHWADRSTLELLAYLARRLRDERVLVLATYRSDEVDRHERLRRFLADVATAARAQRVTLDRLTRAQTLEQLTGILGDAPPTPLFDAVFARAEGNPFFAEELVAAAREGAEGLPATLRDVLLARIHARAGRRAHRRRRRARRAPRVARGRRRAARARLVRRAARRRARARARRGGRRATPSATRSSARPPTRPGPFQAAYARWRQAEAALARRDRAEAEQALRAAHATAAGLGARALQAELEALARRARIELPTAAQEPAAGEPSPAGAQLGLTARELEVLQHLARGATNRQIADVLYISVRTAGVHVSHILGKLSAANRGEAAAIAHRLGLAP